MYGKCGRRRKEGKRGGGGKGGRREVWVVFHTPEQIQTLFCSHQFSPLESAIDSLHPICTQAAATNPNNLQKLPPTLKFSFSVLETTTLTQH